MTLTLRLLVIPFISFAGCLIFHILLWRFYRPKHQASALLGILIGLPFMIFLFWKLPRPYFPWTDFYAILLLHTSLSLAYILVYPASQADSPSFKILLHVGRAMPSGLSTEEIQSRFPASALLDARIQDLINANLARVQSDRLILTRQGRYFIKPFIMLRKALGLPAGAG